MPIMPFIQNETLSQIADNLGLYILSNINSYEPLVKMVGTWSVEERFLECLYRLVKGKCADLEDMLRENLNESHLKVKCSFLSFAN